MGLKIIEVEVSDVASNRNVPGVRLKEEGSGLSWRYVQFRPHFLGALVHLPQIRSLSRQVVLCGVRCGEHWRFFFEISFLLRARARIARKMSIWNIPVEGKRSKDLCDIFILS